jgi:hypothetical protein
MAALNCFFSFEKQVGAKFSWPLSEEVLGKFIIYAYLTRNLKQSTIKSYIASFALYQKFRKMDTSSCFSFHTKMMLQGAKNLEFYRELAKPSRKAVTYPLLKILSHQIALSNWTKHTKQVFWTSLAVAFFGSMRFGELLAPHSKSFNSKETLLWEDISFQEGSVVINVKISKTKNLKGEYIDLFEIPDSRFCPVRALLVLKEMSKNSSGKCPVFTFENGVFLTKESLNKTLHSLLLPILGTTAYQYTGHSFRAALPSALASCPDLVADDQIKKWGRWSTDCFKLYTRLQRKQKFHIFHKILSALDRQ